MNNILERGLFALFLFFPIFVFAKFNIQIQDVVEHKLDEKRVIFKISAQSKEMNYKNLEKTFLFFNKHQMVSNNIFYSNGFFETKDMKISFKKAYFLEGNFVMLDTQGIIENKKFQSKKSIYKYNKIDFENIFITIENKNFRKINYSLDIKL